MILVLFSVHLFFILWFVNKINHSKNKNNKNKNILNFICLGFVVVIKCGESPKLNNNFVFFIA